MAHHLVTGILDKLSQYCTPSSSSQLGPWFNGAIVYPYLECGRQIVVLRGIEISVDGRCREKAEIKIRALNLTFFIRDDQ